MLKGFGQNVGSAERPTILFNLVKMLMPRPSINILEIGSYRGYSAVLWRAALESICGSNGMVVKIRFRLPASFACTRWSRSWTSGSRSLVG